MFSGRQPIPIFSFHRYVSWMHYDTALNEGSLLTNEIDHGFLQECDKEE